MTTNKAIIILGLSGAGKDTFTSGSNYPIVKFSGFIKRQVESLYGLESGSLDDEKTKDTRITDAYGRQLNRTYRDLLIAYFEAVQKTDKTAMFRFVRSEVFRHQADTTIFNDVRTVDEAEYVQHLFDNRVECVILERENRKGATSDRYLHFITEMFPSVIKVKNDSTVEDLVKAGTHIISLLAGVF
jgi:hypothetical protein